MLSNCLESDIVVMSTTSFQQGLTITKVWDYLVVNAFSVHTAFHSTERMDGLFINIQCSPNPVTAIELQQISTQQPFHF